MGKIERAKANAKGKRQPKVEAVEFDREKRRDYLTGFHKRKLARIKQAKEIAATKEKELKREARKELREERKKEVEEMAKALHDEARKAAAFARGVNESDMETDEEDELTAPATTDIQTGEDEFVDEELDGEQKLSTVRIEPMDLDADTSSEEESEEEDDGKEKDGRKNNMAKKKKSDKPKVKKKKFRYLTAGERKQDRRKIREKKDKFKEKRAAMKETSGATRKKR
ncbi:hypothetical protein BJ508DRAFT_414631 [Ascobolus immersus RN42]|uniref:Protein required for cell viability Rrp17 n=1 Tax=Ascobolus immersus RN42 TaxID=1160509 RepID=A0A3N4IC47_ASCIM|nr:hypothetical protein BJ508DRAFT_414631 [Ascobolus immersus RN42]